MRYSRRERMAEVIHEIQLYTIVFLVLVFFLSSSFAYKCQWNEYTVEDIAGNTTCYRCPKCPPGQGLWPECGSRIKYGERFSCKPCVAGTTYSSSYDSSACVPCGICSHKNTLENCMLKHNSKCGRDCEKGFYYESITMDCQPCSWCCGDGKDRVMAHCQDKGMPIYKQCNAEENERCHPRCASNQYMRYQVKTRKRHCQTCPACGIGKGLEPKCSSTVTDSVNITCDHCTPGITFSSTVDSSSCKPCSKCSVGKKVERTCNSTHDTLCGDCLPGFYRDPLDLDAIRCKQCSYCCGDDKDIVIKECAAEGMLPNRQCAYNKRSISVCVPNSNTFYKRSPVKWYYIAIPVLFTVLCIAVVLVCLLAWKYRHRCGYKLLMHQPAPDDTPLRQAETPEFETPVIQNEGKMLWFSFAGIKLHLPEAFSESCTDRDIYEEIKVSVQWNKNYPHLNNNEVILSPAIKIYPEEAKLQKPLTVDFAHCADLTTPNQWSLRVLTQSGSSMGEWTDDLLSIHDEPTAVKFEVSELGKTYIVIGTRTDPKAAKKRMHCAAFAGTPTPGKPITVTLHLIDDCEASLKRLIRAEEKLGHKMNCSLRLCVLDTDPKSLARISIKLVSEGWTLDRLNPSVQSWFNSFLDIPKFEAVFVNNDRTKGDLQCTFVISTQENDCVAEIPVFIYTPQNPYKRQYAQTSSQLVTDQAAAPFVVETVTTSSAKGYRLIASLPPNLTKQICDKIPEDTCISIATDLMHDLTADEVKQIQGSGGTPAQASRLLKTLNEKIPDLSVVKFNDTLNKTPGCDDVVALLAPFLKENGGIECV